MSKLFKEKLLQKISFYFLYEKYAKKITLIFKGNLFLKFFINFQRKINIEKLRYKF